MHMVFSWALKEKKEKIWRWNYTLAKRDISTGENKADGVGLFLKY